MITAARIEYSHGGEWVFWANVYDTTPERAEKAGLEIARHLWRKRVAGVRVVVAAERVVLEKMRDG